jgi:nucleoid-associated protein YgaU
MFKHKVGLLLLVLIVVTVVGCAGSGVTTRTYVEDKERVDQKMDESGYNYGYIQGTPKAEDRSEYKKTRKIFVLEMTKEPPEIEEAAVPASTARPRSTRETIPEPEPERREPPEWTKPIEIPAIDDVQPQQQTVSSGTFTDYEVQKGDTLQKISKKFYDTYRKWGRIYEANKDVLSDPDQLKPGMTLRIPTEGGAPLGENLK